MKREGLHNAMQGDSAKLRELASWYREQSEQAGNPVIWEARLRTAEDLDVEATRIEGNLSLSSSLAFSKQTVREWAMIWAVARG